MGIGGSRLAPCRVEHSEAHQSQMMRLAPRHMPWIWQSGLQPGFRENPTLIARIASISDDIGKPKISGLRKHAGTGSAAVYA